ncbi:alpha/beta hydrolase [Kocuria marina]|uniref:alpha/beta hydrolase n=1 Tax=Kocuria marina TaxID=223184 RepID=UPI003F23F4E0
MPVHPDARKFLDLVAGAPPMDTRTAEQNRADASAALQLTGHKTPMARVEDRAIAGVPVRVYVPHDLAVPSPAVVFFHGGGWVVGDLEIADTTVRDIAAQVGATVISVDYRQAPEDVFPAAVEDALAVVTSVLDGTSGEELDVRRVAIAGDSAGGNLTAVVAQQLRDHEPAPVHQVLVYPVTDLTWDATGSYETYAENHFLTTRGLEYFYATYAADADRADPLLSPARAADLTGLPPATVITAECDPLLDQAEAYAHAMSAAGVPVTAVRFLGQVHPFLFLGGLIADAHAARRFIAAQLRTALATDA